MPRDGEIKVLYNDSDINIKENNLHPQGGITRFAQLFRGYFKGVEDITLVPFLFSPVGNDDDPVVRHIISARDEYAEVSYDRSIISALHTERLPRGKFVDKLRPILNRIEYFMISIRPDIIFLNGFGISNWMLMWVGHKLSIPVVIQHAGVWKREIKMTFKDFLPQIRRNFYGLERDTIKYCAHHIFLTEASRDEFQRLHSSQKTIDKFKNHSSIIPLSVDIRNVANGKKANKNKNVEIGVVARWDAIKNHTAILKLASSPVKPSNWHVQTVTKIRNKKFNFVQRYMKHIDIIEPMSPEELVSFYKRMDITILPSHFETFGGVVIESWLTGTPAIISERVGLVSLYRKFGLDDHVVKTSISGKKMVETIDNILSNKDKYKEIYEQLIKHIQENFNTEAVLSRYLETFKRYLDK